MSEETPTIYEIEDRRKEVIKLMASVTSWEAKQAALRLLFGTSLVIPSKVRIRSTLGSK